MRKRQGSHYLLSVEARNEVNATFDCTRIQYMEKHELLGLQQQLGLGETWGTITMPKEWLAPGAMRAANTVHLTTACECAESETEAEQAILALTRYAILLFLVPAFGARSRTLLSASTILAYLRQLSTLVRIALQRPTQEENGFFSRLCADDLSGLVGAKEKAVVLDHMVAYAAQGYWADAPYLEDEDNKEERSRSANARHPRKGRHKNVWLPLPDEFVAAAGWRMIWITKTLGPALLTCIEGLISQYKASLPVSVADKRQLRRIRTDIAKDYLRKYCWKSTDGKALESLPFELQLSDTRARDGKFEWPPLYLSEVVGILRLLQAAHLFLFLLCTGARASEALGLEPNHVIQNPERYPVVEGRMFKPSFSNEGRRHDWPLPPVVVWALEQQERLSNVVDGIKPWSLDEDELDIDAKNLFVSLLTGDDLRNTYNTQLRNAISSLQLNEELDERGLHSHRFRKTLARLGALAIIGAPKIFMDLFGHENADVTLTYMLTDPMLQAEMQEVRKAEVIMLAERVIDTAEDNGGPASAKVKEAVQAERIRLGKQFGKDDVRALAETFTMGGEIWKYVRPGVICTKTPLQSGPCNIRVARPEPSRCNCKCEHRLEEAALRTDVDKAIGDAIGFYTKDKADGKYFQAEMWEGQILQNLNRFPDLMTKWSCNEVVASVIARNKEEVA